jgi:outer membrane protein TolC
VRALASILAWVAASVPAQGPAVIRLTVDEAVERALAHSPRLRGLGATDAAAGAAVDQARADAKPRLDLSLGYTRFSDVPEFVVGIPGNTTPFFPNIPDNPRVRIGASYPLYTGGRVEALVESAGGEKTSADEQLQAARGDLVLETRRAYWTLVTAAERVRVVAENLSAFEAHLTDARNRERFGLSARNEVLAVEVDRDRAELSRLRAETQSRIASANLGRLLGLRPGESIEPVESLAPSGAPPEDEEALVSFALRNRPELAAIRGKLAAAEAQARLERSHRLPQVSVGAGLYYAHPNPRYLPPEAEWNGNWEVGVIMGWSLFDGGRSSSGERQAGALAEAVRAELEDLEERIRLDVVSALLEVENAHAEVELADRARDAARESRRVAAERYREGVILSSELLDAEVAALRADLDLTEALAAERLAAAALDHAVGSANRR